MELRTIKDNAPQAIHTHGHKAPVVWIVIADHKIARVFKKAGAHIELIDEAYPTLKERKKGTPDGSIGRVTSLHGSNHHKLEPRLKPGRHDSLNFAQDLSEWLRESAEAELYDRLILVAAPRTLGELRPRLHKAVQARIIAEIDKELTKMNQPELEQELKKIVWF